MIMEIGPPKIIPNVPVKNITIAFAPNFLISGMSMLTVSNTKLEGNKYLDATKYNLDSSPEMIPAELKRDGMKQQSNKVGTYL